MLKLLFTFHQFFTTTKSHFKNMIRSKRQQSQEAYSKAFKSVGTVLNEGK